MTDKQLMLNELKAMMEEVKNDNVTDLIMAGKSKKEGKLNSIISDPFIALGLIEGLHIDAKCGYLEQKRKDSFLNGENPDWGLDEDGEFYYKNLDED